MKRIELRIAVTLVAALMTVSQAHADRGDRGGRGPGGGGGSPAPGGGHGGGGGSPAPGFGRGGGGERPSPGVGRGGGDRPSPAPGFGHGGGDRPSPGFGRGGGDRPSPGFGRGGGDRPSPGFGRGGGDRPSPGFGRGGGDRPSPGFGRGGGDRPSPGVGRPSPGVGRPSPGIGRPAPGIGDGQRGTPGIGRGDHGRGPGPGRDWRPRHDNDHHSRWEGQRRGDWNRNIGSNPRWSRHAGNWDRHWSKWDSHWAYRNRLVSERRLHHIDSYLWLSFWRTRYHHDDYYFYPPYAYEGEDYYVEDEPDFSSEPAPHYMEAAVESFLNIRSSPYVSENNVCGQLPAGAVVPVVSVVKTEENGLPWAMIKLDEDTREFLTDQGCESLDYVFAALDYLK